MATPGQRSTTREIPPLEVRAEVAPGSWDAEKRTVEVIWGTGARVRRSGWFTDTFDEELDMSASAVRMDKLSSGKAPVYDSHQRWGGTDSVRGVVVRASVDGKRGTATLRFAKADADPAADQLFRKIGDGIVTGVSVGYRVFKYEKQPKANPLDPNEVPVMRATDWEPYELSPCGLGADPTAEFRSTNHQQQQSNACEFINRNEESMTTAAAVAAAAALAVPTEPVRAAPTTPAPVAVAPAPPAPSAAELTAATDAGRTAERARADGITTAVRAAKLPVAFGEKLIKDNTSIDAAREAVIAELARASDATPNNAQVIMVGDDRTKMGERGRAQAWILQKAGQLSLIQRAAAKFPEHPAFKDMILDPGEFRGMTLSEMARDSLERAGAKNVKGMDRQQMIGESFLRGIGGANSSSDFPIALENTLHKVLLAAYLITQDTWDQFCMIGTVSDFRAHPRYRMGSFGVLDALGEGGEYKNKSIPDATKQSITAATKGNIIALTRKAIINDDMDVFSRVAMMIGRAAKLSIEVDVYALLAQNGALGPLMGDGLPLFDAAHANINAVGSAISVVGLDADRVILKNQKDQDGNEYLDLGGPSILLINTSLGSTARVINDAQYDPDTANKLQRPNAMRGLFSKIIDTPRIAGTRRYLLADPAVAPVLEVAFLDGQREPYMETRQGWSIDGTEWKVRLDYATAAIDVKGGVTNAGV